MICRTLLVAGLSLVSVQISGMVAQFKLFYLADLEASRNAFLDHKLVTLGWPVPVRTVERGEGIADAGEGYAVLVREKVVIAHGTQIPSPTVALVSGALTRAGPIVAFEHGLFG
jgi:hypothetical protein